MTGWTILKTGSAVVALAAIVAIADFFDLNLFEGAKIVQVVVGPPGTMYEGTDFIVLLREAEGLVYVMETDEGIYIWDSVVSLKAMSFYQIADSGATHIMRIEDLENGLHPVITEGFE